MFYTELNLTRKVSRLRRTTSYFSKRKLLEIHFQFTGSFWGNLFSAHSSHQHFSLRRSDKLLLAKPLPNPCDCSVWGWGVESRSSPLLGVEVPTSPGFHSPSTSNKYPCLSPTSPSPQPQMLSDWKIKCVLSRLQSCLTL